MPHPAPWRPAPPSGVFTTVQVAAMGYSDAAIRHAVRTGNWQRLRRGFYRLAPLDALAEHERRRIDLHMCAEAAQLACSDSMVSHSASATLQGLPTYRAPNRPCVTVPPESGLRTLAGAHLHRATVPAQHRLVVAGTATTTAARAVLDIAREIGVAAAVVTADAALRSGTATMDELWAALDIEANWPGRAVAQAAVAAARSEAESPLESLSRLAIAAAGLPEPTLQQEIGDGNGTFLGRVDFYWDEFGVVGEADGRLKYAPGADGMRAVLAEKERESRLAETGLIVVRWGWEDLQVFGAVAGRLQSALRRGIGRSRGRAWSLLN